MTDFTNKFVVIFGGGRDIGGAVAASSLAAVRRSHSVITHQTPRRNRCNHCRGLSPFAKKSTQRI